MVQSTLQLNSVRKHVGLLVSNLLCYATQCVMAAPWL